VKPQTATGTSAGQSNTTRGKGAPTTHSELIDAATQTEWVPIGTLLPADSPRLDGEDMEHTRMLAESGATLPPVIVHRGSMRIIDGMHRMGAAVLRGDEMIEVRFFDGSVQEAFVLAVKTNIAHGRPLSLTDRTTAAQRIINDHPTWSDRAIAVAVGLGARTVGGIRKRIQAEGEGGHGTRERMGRDGRVRPLDNTEGRLRAAEVIRSQPGASLREIAKNAGVSPTTARDVRKRIQRGDDPLPRSASRNGTAAAGPPAGGRTQQPGLGAILEALQRDPSLRFSESGRALLRWVLSRAVQPGEWQEVSGDVPAHCTYIMVDVARRCADEWLRVADDLERRVQQAAEPHHLRQPRPVQLHPLRS
jgi:hypothetical protein